MAMRKGLGKGLGALIEDFNEQPNTPGEGAVTLPLQKIEPNPLQPRKTFNPEELDSLADSIRMHGIIQPLTVRKLPSGFYQIIAGERRWRAARLAGLSDVPVVIIEADDKKAMELALIENLQRQDLDIFDQAEGISRLIGYWGVTQEEAAAKLGLAQSTLANKLRLLRLSAPVQELIRQNGLTERHGRALLKLPDEAAQLAAAKTICKKSMTVSQAEQYINTLLARQKMKKPTRLFICKDIRLFMNTIDKAVKTMTEAGLAVQSAREDQGEFIELTIRIPKEPGQRPTAKPA